MKRLYALYNRITKKYAYVHAESAPDACNSKGWDIADCWFKELSSNYFSYYRLSKLKKKSDHPFQLDLF